MFKILAACLFITLLHSNALADYRRHDGYRGQGYGNRHNGYRPGPVRLINYWQPVYNRCPSDDRRYYRNRHNLRPNCRLGRRWDSRCDNNYNNGYYNNNYNGYY